MERPYFLFGTGRDPVNLWDWTSDQAGAREMVGRGIGALEEQPPESQGTSADATWDNGQWRVLFTRALATDDPASDVQFPMSEAVPVAFFAWDGDNGESGARSSVSSWYFVYLTEPTPPTVLVAPLLAMALTAGLGLVVVARAQRREDEDEAAEGTGDED
jgi:DMSO reductase family type II enzyme heme b subunit